MASGIKDKVAILGMGCSKFGERWDAEAEDLIVEAFEECVADAGVDTGDIQAAWFATAIEEAHVGKSGVPLAMALRLPFIPVTRVENFCASGSEAFRGAVYAVASGACDIALALGVEKLKDTGFGGLPPLDRGSLTPLWWANVSAPGSFAQLASAYCAKHGVAAGDLKRAMAHVSAKSHANGVKNPKAHLQKEVAIETIMEAPMVAEPLGLYDCCPTTDGAAAIVLCRADLAEKRFGKKDFVLIDGMGLSCANGYITTQFDPRFDFLGFESIEEVRTGFASYFWRNLYPNVSDGIQLLEQTGHGRTMLSNMYGHLLVSERGMLR